MYIVSFFNINVRLMLDFKQIHFLGKVRLDINIYTKSFKIQPKRGIYDFYCRLKKKNVNRKKFHSQFLTIHHFIVGLQYILSVIRNMFLNVVS